MSDIHYTKDIPDGAIRWTLGKRSPAIVTQNVFDRLGDYTRSVPTGPTPGRVYKKNLGWPPNMEDNWFIYFCVRDPNDDKMVLHVPRRLTIEPSHKGEDDE